MIQIHGDGLLQTDHSTVKSSPGCRCQSRGKENDMENIILVGTVAWFVGGILGGVFGLDIGYKWGWKDAEEEELERKFIALAEAARRKAHESDTGRD